MLQADSWNQELGGTAQLSPGFSRGECQVVILEGSGWWFPVFKPILRMWEFSSS